MYGTFEGEYLGTIGIDFMSHVVFVDGVAVRLQIWDTAGQERFNSLIPTYIRGSEAVFLVYDVTKSADVIQAELERWHRMVVHEGTNPVLMLLANKVDRDDIRKVNNEWGKKMAEKMGAIYWETSAKTGQNVKKAFEGAAAAIAAPLEQPRPLELFAQLRPPTPDGKGCACYE